MTELVVLRALMDEAQTVVHRQFRIDLPVVLEVGVDVVVHRRSFYVFRGLHERAEAADGGVGEAERGIELVRPDRVLLEVQYAERIVVRLLGLEAVRDVQTGLRGVASDELR